VKRPQRFIEWCDFSEQHLKKKDGGGSSEPPPSLLAITERSSDFTVCHPEVSSALPKDLEGCSVAASSHPATSHQEHSGRAGQSLNSAC